MSDATVTTDVDSVLNQPFEAIDGSHAFDIATNVNREGSNKFSKVLSTKWQGDVAVPHGGYMLSVSLEALSRFYDGIHPHPVSATCYYAKPARTGKRVDIDIHELRRGRQFSTAIARMSQNGQLITHVVATFGDLSQTKGLATVIMDSPNKVVHPRECIASRSGGVIARQCHLLSDPREKPVSKDRAERRHCIRFKDGRAPCVKSLAFFADAFTPPTWKYGMAFLGGKVWTPTVELNIQFRKAVINPGWLKQHIYTRFLLNGRFEVDMDIFDEQDELVCVARQMGITLSHEKQTSKL
ncbi:hypothetical protein SmJEL517_g05578 [Synchytrium microbalum]|uniref:Thioesterase domain-containing protein n=1 Tax=Synchytrium microbalum TaxID=1806994 RepID=A0A507C084_9FUNG|nr:uncharacterized protein SmJEL517_g05578 [Synchytrium microbalum]TPX30995.1 hypothetical protein SmJEL517_g05578 [Synchytrium microbalum]